MTNSAYEIAKALGGKRSGTGWLIRCPNPSHDDRNPSCVVSDDHNGQPIFYCFAGCHWQDIKAGAERLGLVEPFKPGEGQSCEERQKALAKAREQRAQIAIEKRKSDNNRIAMANQLWNDAWSDAVAVGRYFNARGITIVPDKFRYHDTAWNKEVAVHMPAIFAPLLNTANGKFQGLQLIYLNCAGTRKASLEASKITRGVMRGAAVQLAVPGDTLAVAEGVETALSYQQMSGTPTWAVLGTSGLKAFEPPTDVKQLTIAADNDQPGREAAKTAASNLTTKGLRVQVTWPKTEGADFNDVLAGASS